MPSPEQKICQNCKIQFAIELEDLDFYKKINVPPPTRCPECRLIKRLSWRNERSLFRRKCDLCGEEKILIFPRQSPHTIYCFPCWWSEKWNPESYAQDYDFSRPFFEQFKELFLKVPRLGIIQQGTNINSVYTNRVSDNKNCYLVFASANNENCSYGTSIWGSKDSVDNYNIHSSELCFECVDCFGCNRLLYSQECNHCTNSAFLLNCRNCSDCFGCVNLRNKNYCIFNEQLTKDEYKKRLAEFQLNKLSNVEKMRKSFVDFAKKFIVPSFVENHSVNVSGNWLEECKNVSIGFNCEKVEDGKYLFGIIEAKDVMDYTYWGKSSELIYECSSIGRQCSSVFFSNECWDQLIRSQYCANCHSSSDLFGCVGLRKKQYCILNKQYSKAEYEKMTERIREQMAKMPYQDSIGRTFRYGDTFPLDIHSFAYNETIAQELFPISREKAIEQGYRWADPEERNYAVTLKPENIPDAIEETEEQILKETIGCLHEGKCNHQCTTAFRITSDDLIFHKRIGIPIPQLCPNCRHFARLVQRTPIRLWHRACTCAGQKSKNGSYVNTATHFHGTPPCPNEFETAYAPECSNIVYCKQCYQAEVV
ncbi:MAG: hypothetical protein A3J67_06375 [Parcubacteria group bacterium RIFCSPHIGHO2_02_FULL_48_10b]|nr:MAG: hypothetical protein A3J67_06375 [Parcubacteria group bacterium RIFCSPHIGHO2_02_FULL_48_10b]